MAYLTLRILLPLVLAPLLLLGCTRVNRVPELTAYHAWWMAGEWRNAHWDKFDRLFFFEIVIDSSGRLEHRNGWPEAWHDLIDSTRRANIGLDLVLTLFDPGDFNKLFTDSARIDTLLAAAEGLLVTTRGVGIQLDVEIYDGSSAAAVDGYRRFVKVLRNRIARSHRQTALSAFVPGGDGLSLYDQETLKCLDFYVIQGYDAHSEESDRAGPISISRGDHPFSWSVTLSRIDSLGGDRSKALVSIPYYGYEWPTVTSHPGALTRGEGRLITFAPVSPELLPYERIAALDRIHEYGAKRDPVSASPFYQYSQNGEWFEGWYEDELSISTKLRDAREAGLRGAAVFVLGYDQNRLTETILRAFGRYAETSEARAP